MSCAALGRLHVITDTCVQTRFSHTELAQLAVAGGADTVQFREKRPWSTRELVATADSIVAAITTAAYDATIIVNDRVDVCVAANAGGVHLGQHDLPVEIARGLVGRGRLIGGTANSVDAATRLARLPLDYLGVGPVFGTRSKAQPAPTLGLEGLRAIVAIAAQPVIAIGSIDADNVGDVLSTGVRGVAVLSAVVGAADPKAATATIRAAISQWRSTLASTSGVRP